MDTTSTGDLVKVATPGPLLDGIVFEAAGSAKVMVAVMDRDRGPVLRSVERSALTERTEAGPDDAQLQLLIRRTPHGARGGGNLGGGVGPGRSGAKRAAMHRTTGK